MMAQRACDGSWQRPFPSNGWRRKRIALTHGLALWTASVGCDFDGEAQFYAKRDDVATSAAQKVVEGRDIFRFDTFGSEAFWGDALKLHLAIAGQANGGVGPGIDPTTALRLGLKVDSDALSNTTLRRLRAGQLDLNDPAVTLQLLRENAVVGLKGTFDHQGRIQSIGIQCSLCHSTVDDKIAPSIGRRRDGWPNRDLLVGTIIAAAPDLSVVTQLLGVDDATLREVLRAWPAGHFDAVVFLDGKALRPDGRPATTLIPAAFGMAGVNLHTYTGWGSISHWNALVANLEMHGQGRFYDPRLNDPIKFPIAAANGFGDVRSERDLITEKLPALQLYQLALDPPTPPRHSFDPRAAERGRALFEGKADCARCHVPPLFTEPGWNMHTPQEIGIDDFQASRSPDGHYRTTPLRGLFTRAKGGFYHDGRFPDLLAVVQHYDTHFSLDLSADERNDLVEYLKSL